MNEPDLVGVSVLFNEPKLLKALQPQSSSQGVHCFSALQRAEIAEISLIDRLDKITGEFQCSSTSRNC